MQEAIDLDGKFFPAKLSLGKLLMDQGRVEDAAPVLANAAELEPYNSQVHFELSQAFRSLGENEQADAELARMREIQVLHRQFTDLHLVATEEPMNADVRDRLAGLARQLGKPQLAQTWIRAAAAIRADRAKVSAASKLNVPVTADQP